LHKAGDTRACEARKKSGRSWRKGRGLESPVNTNKAQEKRAELLPAARALFALPRNELVFASSVSLCARRVHARAPSSLLDSMTFRRFRALSAASSSIIRGKRPRQRPGGRERIKMASSLTAALSSPRFLPWPKIIHRLHEIARSPRSRRYFSCRMPNIFTRDTVDRFCRPSRRSSRRPSRRPTRTSAMG